eukprot:TRINITY_DN25998_c0_g1_i1.p1 TRINITY_DN25998_c0_g1~~TRINITY_DN25998_c0_g1_i1.p1  ORF type:complete len:251 (+),score=54.02 TRINITY_DN25998_c0_g1_i1:87-839(+)
MLARKRRRTGSCSRSPMRPAARRRGSRREEERVGDGVVHLRLSDGTLVSAQRALADRIPFIRALLQGDVGVETDCGAPVIHRDPAPVRALLSGLAEGALLSDVQELDRMVDEADFFCFVDGAVRVRLCRPRMLSSLLTVAGVAGMRQMQRLFETGDAWRPPNPAAPSAILPTGDPQWRVVSAVGVWGDDVVLWQVTGREGPSRPVQTGGRLVLWQPGESVYRPLVLPDPSSGEYSPRVPGARCDVVCGCL